MILGGIPFYLSLLDPAKSMIENIDYLFFRRNSEMRTEFDELYNAIFNNAGKYLEVVEALYRNKAGLTSTEIRNTTGIEGKMLATTLRNLERCDFIISFTQFGNKSRGTLYRLVDFYTLFYFKFIKSLDTKDEQWWQHNYNSRSVESWQGTSFELVCLTHLNQIKLKLGISGISTCASSWRYNASEESTERGAQIDLVIDRGDHVINLCEIKFCATRFSVTADYERTIRDRERLFREKTGTSKTLVCTFITTFGVVKGTHYGIVDNEVDSNDLFA